MATYGTLPTSLQNLTSGGMSVAPTQSIKPVTTPAITQSTTVKAPTGTTSAYKLPEKPVGTASAVLGANVGANVGGTTVTTPPAYDIMTGQLTAYGKSVGSKDVNGAQAPATPTTPTAPAPLTGKELALQRLDDAYTQLGGKAKAVSDANTAEGVDEKTRAVNEINKKYDARALSYENQIRALQQNVEGRYGTGTNVAVQNLERQKAQELADLAIEKAGIQGDLNTAMNIVKQKIDAQYEPITLQIQSLRDYATINANDLTESEKIKITAEANKLQKQIDILGDADKDAYKIALDGGANQATLDKIGKAKTVADKYAAIGVYGVSVEKRAQANKVNREAQAAGLPLISSSTSTDYSQALSVILGSSKFTAGQKADVIKAVNSGQDPFTVIKNQGKNIMGQTEATKLGNFETAKSSMQDLDTALKSYYANGGSTSILTGNYEKVINKLGEVNDPKLVELAVQIQSGLQIYRNAVSGTAYSVQEGKDIASIFPGINKSQGLNQSIISGRLKAFDSVIDGTYRTALGESYDQIKKSETAVKSTPPEAISPTIISAVQMAVKNSYSPVSIIQKIQGDPTVAKYIAKAKANNYSDQEIVDYIKNFK
jgi:hypothetical protein